MYRFDLKAWVSHGDRKLIWEALKPLIIPTIIGIFIGAGIGLALLRSYVWPYEAKEKAEQKQIEEVEVKIKEQQKKIEDLEKKVATRRLTLNRGAQRTINEWGISRDESIARINAYLEGSRLAGFGDIFYDRAIENGNDPRFSPAIACVESGKGSKDLALRSNNCWGMTKGCVPWAEVDVKGKFQAFKSLEDGIKGHNEYLARMWPDATSPYVMKAYAADPAWEGKVLSEMEKI